MTRRKKPSNEQDDDDAPGILKDGERLHVPLMTLDGECQPSSPNVPMLDARELAREQWMVDMENAWRGDAGQQAVRQIEMKPLTGDAREDAYEAYGRSIEDAWRGPPNSGKWPAGSGR